MRVSRGEVVMNYVLLIAFALFALAPVLTILIGSVSAPLGEPAGFYPGNYLEAWTVGGFGSSLGNSVVVAAIDVVIITAVATLFAFLYNLSAFVMGGLEVTLAED